MQGARRKEDKMCVCVCQRSCDCEAEAEAEASQSSLSWFQGHTQILGFLISFFSSFLPHVRGSHMFYCKHGTTCTADN